MVAVSKDICEFVWVSLQIDSGKDVHCPAPFRFGQALSLFRCQVERWLTGGGILERKRIAMGLVGVQEVGEIDVAVSPDLFFD